MAHIISFSAAKFAAVISELVLLGNCHMLQVLLSVVTMETNDLIQNITMLC